MGTRSQKSRTRWSLGRRRSTLSAEEIFTDIYRSNAWNGTFSVSGPSGELSQTARIIAALPALFRGHGVRSVLDIPCGDFYWMRHVDLTGVRYLGADIVAELVARNAGAYERPHLRFKQLDLLGDPLPRVDLVLCRDALVHFSLADARRALENIGASGSALLLTTTFLARKRNRNTATGGWRPLNLERAPFRLPPPTLVLEEGCTLDEGKYADKALGLWRIGDVKAALAAPPRRRWLR